MHNGELTTWSTWPGVHLSTQYSPRGSHPHPTDSSILAALLRVILL